MEWNHQRLINRQNKRCISASELRFSLLSGEIPGTYDSPQRPPDVGARCLCEGLFKKTLICEICVTLLYITLHGQKYVDSLQPPGFSLQSSVRIRIGNTTGLNISERWTTNMSADKTQNSPKSEGALFHALWERPTIQDFCKRLHRRITEISEDHSDFKLSVHVGDPLQSPTVVQPEFILTCIMVDF